MPKVASPEPETQLGRGSRVSPEPDPSPGAEPGAAPQPEPVPQWSSAIETWDGAWTFHVYGLGGLFALLALATAVLLVLVARRRIVATRMVTPVLLFVLAMAATRSAFLLGDAYGSRMLLAPPLLQALAGLTMPCLMSAYSLLLYTTKRAFRPRNLASRDPLLTGLAVAIGVYFAASVTADVLIGLDVACARSLVIACNGVFIAWGLVLYVAFGSVGLHLYQQIRSSQRLSGKKGAADRAGAIPWKRYRRPVIIIGMATACGLGVMVLYAYGLTAVYHMYASGSVFPRAWPWLAYQTAARLLELAMAALILYATILTPGNQDRIRSSVAVPRRISLRRRRSSNAFEVSTRTVDSAAAACYLEAVDEARSPLGESRSVSPLSTHDLRR